MDRWDFARRAFDEHFMPLRSAGYELERLTHAEAYWALHEVELRAHFPPEVFFLLSEVRSAAEREGQARLAETCAGEQLRDFTVVRQAGALVAMFSGEQKSAGLYRMWHSNVHPAFRNKGVYRQILKSTISYTRELGFDSIGSEHSPSNNAILIAKLRAGFHIFGLEIDAGPGLSLLLRYFHNPEHRAAYQLRCGDAALTPGLIGCAGGAWPKFRDQVR